MKKVPLNRSCKNNAKKLLVIANTKLKILNFFKKIQNSQKNISENSKK
jgi:hypothetical protein